MTPLVEVRNLKIGFAQGIAKIPLCTGSILPSTAARPLRLSGNPVRGNRSRPVP